VPDNLVVAAAAETVPVPAVVVGVKRAVEGTVEQVWHGWILKGALVLVPVNADGGPIVNCGEARNTCADFKGVGSGGQTFWDGPHVDSGVGTLVD
jgi:hypothetical protein